MNRLKAWLADFPTTAARIVATIVLAIFTALVVWWCFLTQRPLDADNFGDWLIFLAVMAGIDSAHFVAKRVTAWKPPETPTASEAPAPGDKPAEVAPVVGPLDGPTPPIGAAHTFDPGA